MGFLCVEHEQKPADLSHLTAIKVTVCVQITGLFWHHLIETIVCSRLSNLKFISVSDPDTRNNQICHCCHGLYMWSILYLVLESLCNKVLPLLEIKPWSVAETYTSQNAPNWSMQKSRLFRCSKICLLSISCHKPMLLFCLIYDLFWIRILYLKFFCEKLLLVSKKIEHLCAISYYLLYLKDNKEYMRCVPSFEAILHFQEQIIRWLAPKIIR